MSEVIEIRVPDIGDFTDIPVVEVLVQAGDRVGAEQSLVTLESEKAIMEIPSPVAGVIRSVDVAEEDFVSEGSLVAVLDADEAVADSDSQTPAQTQNVADQHRQVASPPQQSVVVEEDIDPSADYDFDVLVLGAGPGGYTAAFRAADLGLKVALIERYPALGGVCLNVGCIPSKALLHAAAVIDEAAAMSDHGVVFGSPEIDLDKLRGWKEKVVGQLTGGLASMSKQRGVTVIQGDGMFSEAHEMTIETADGPRMVSFARAIIAAGSQAFKLPGLPWDDPRVMDSTDALELKDVPEHLLVIGGGIIGLEMASVYQGLGSEVTVVELTSQLMPGTDKDLVRPLQNRIKTRYAGIFVNTKVTSVKPADDGLHVSFEGSKLPENTVFDRVLVSTGRTPNGNLVGAKAAGVEITERGPAHAGAQGNP